MSFIFIDFLLYNYYFLMSLKTLLSVGLYVIILHMLIEYYIYNIVKSNSLLFSF